MRKGYGYVLTKIVGGVQAILGLVGAIMLIAAALEGKVPVAAFVVVSFLSVLMLWGGASIIHWYPSASLGDENDLKDGTLYDVIAQGAHDRGMAVIVRDEKSGQVKAVHLKKTLALPSPFTKRSEYKPSTTVHSYE